VVPFVELPLVACAELAESGQLDQLSPGKIAYSELVDVANPKAADERPDAAVVIVIWQVE